MDIALNAHEARVLGVLVEKAFTTPDQYPLSLNAATNGSNQKSNRDPQVDFSEAEVTVALQGLRMKHLVGASFPAGGRVEKWRHNAKEILKIEERELAILTELLLRGPQTPGELRGRAKRMRDVPNLEELEVSLGKLEEKGYVQHVAPAPGSRAGRYGQTLAKHLHPDGTDEVTAQPVPQTTGSASPGAPGTSLGSAPAPTPEPRRVPAAAPRAPVPDSTGLNGRVAHLEEQVRTLRAQLNELAEKLGETLGE